MDISLDFHCILCYTVRNRAHHDHKPVHKSKIAVQSTLSKFDSLHHQNMDIFRYHNSDTPRDSSPYMDNLTYMTKDLCYTLHNTDLAALVRFRNRTLFQGKNVFRTKNYSIQFVPLPYNQHSHNHTVYYICLISQRLYTLDSEQGKLKTKKTFWFSCSGVTVVKTTQICTSSHHNCATNDKVNLS